METKEDNQNENRPSASELLGASPEQIKRQGEPAKQYDPDNISKPHKSNIFQLYIGTASLILLLLGLTALGIWFFTTESAEESVETTMSEPTSFIQTNERAEVQVSNLRNLTTRLEQLPEGEYPGKSMTHIFFTLIKGEEEQLIDSHDLLDSLGGERPTISLYLENNYMYGRYYEANGESFPYMIFAVADYNNAYGTILQTEVELVSALEPLGFPVVTNFEDVIIQNQDVRVSGENEDRSLYYSFPRKNRLVITTSEAALREIFNRLRQR